MDRSVWMAPMSGSPMVAWADARDAAGRSVRELFPVLGDLVGQKRVMLRTSSPSPITTNRSSSGPKPMSEGWCPNPTRRRSAGTPADQAPSASSDESRLPGPDHLVQVADGEPRRCPRPRRCTGSCGPSRRRHAPTPPCAPRAAASSSSSGSASVSHWLKSLAQAHEPTVIGGEDRPQPAVEGGGSAPTKSPSTWEGLCQRAISTIADAGSVGSASRRPPRSPRLVKSRVLSQSTSVYTPSRPMR